MRPEDRRVFYEDREIQKIHPVSGEVIATYRVSAQHASNLSAKEMEQPPPPLSRDEWTAVLCTGKCRQGTSSRCNLDGQPTWLFGEARCVAEILQLHPQGCK